MQKDAVSHVVLPMRLLHAQEQLRRGEWNFDTFNGRQLDTSSRFFKVDTARRSHYIDQDVVRNADDHVVAEIVVAELENGLLRKTSSAFFTRPWLAKSTSIRMSMSSVARMKPW
jgi:hypothetical protein